MEGTTNANCTSNEKTIKTKPSQVRALKKWKAKNPDKCSAYVRKWYASVKDDPEFKKKRNEYYKEKRIVRAQEQKEELLKLKEEVQILREKLSVQDI
jgi:hypothetical protein